MLYLLLRLKYVLLSFIVCFNILIPNTDSRDCPDYYILNPQYPIIGPECFPEDFIFNNSSNQAFYYFQSVEIDGESLDSDDWVGVFNGSTCIGARQWDTSQCNNNICDIPVMGDDGSEYSDDYIVDGQIPTFKIYDHSENIYFNATPSSYESWYNLQFILVDSLAVSTFVEGCIDENACNFNSGATQDDGTCTYPEENFDCYGACIVEIDCNGQCGGNAVYDECGICGGSGIIEGTCDCDGNIDLGCGCAELGPTGCDNVCGSIATLDQCGVCDDNIYNDCIQDCLGNWGGDAIFDDCGVCDGNNNHQDCFGVCFGDAIEDECGICGGSGASCNIPEAYNQNIEINEDSFINFIINAFDPNDDTLELILVSNTIHGQLEILEGLNVRYIPDNNFSGIDNFTYRVSDGIWESNEAQVTIIINEVYDPPIVSDINIELLEDESTLIDLGAYDTDSEDSNLIFSIIEYPNFGFLIEQRATATYEYTPNSNYNGQDQFIYEVTDGENTSQAAVFITILNANDIPIVSNFIFSDLEVIDFSEYINDIDGDILTLRTIPPSDGENLRTVFGNELVYTGSDYLYIYNPSGPFDILLYKATDGIAVSTPALGLYEDFTGALNRSIPQALDDEVLMEEDNIVQISFFAFDYDGFINGTPIIEVITFPQYGELGELSDPVISDFVAEWTATFTPIENYFGEDNISFSVIDDNGEFSEVDGIISITINEVNDSPILSSINDLDFNEDDTSSIELSFSDIDGDQLTISMSQGANISFTQDENQFTFNASSNWFGTETFTATISDGELSDSKTFTIAINPINDFPELNFIGNKNFDEDASLSFFLNASDIDADILTYNITSGINIMPTINDNNLIFTTDADFYGSENFTVTISDGLLDDQETFEVTVNPINDAPIITSVSQSEILASDGYFYQLEVDDIDSDNLVYDLIGSPVPNNMTIDNNGSVIWANNDIETYSAEFVISVSDAGYTVYENINLFIIQFYDCSGVANGGADEDCAGICNGDAQDDQCGICNGDNSFCSGCTIDTACNYDSSALLNNGLCEYPETFYDCDEICLNDSDGDSICNELEIEGCTDIDACNYNPAATDEDGSCIYAEENFDCDGNCISPIDCAGVCGGLSEVDCLGECNGMTELDECGVCDGQGLIMCDDGSMVCDISECPSDDLAYIGTPEWDSNTDGVLDNYNDYENNGSITAMVTIDEGALSFASPGDMIAVFVDEEQRGVAIASQIPFGPYQGDYQFQMMIYSNETVGELLTFQYFDISANAVYNMPQTLAFEANMIIGNVISPYIFIFNPGIGDILGCTDELACNYYSFATQDDGSCIYAEENYDCDGNCLFEIDECGICSGDNSTCEDCAGIPNGDAVEDECGVCDYLPWNDCTQDCNDEWGGTAVVDDCGVCGGDNASCTDECGVVNGDGTSCLASLSLGSFDASGSLEVLYDFGGPVAGFQFEVTGLALTGGSGGAAGDVGLTVSTGGTTVLGFSFDNSEIVAGTGLLTVLSFSSVTDTSTDLAIGWNGAITDASGNVYTSSASGSIDHGDPDCSGAYYGDAVVDECGECGGAGIADGACDCDGNVDDCFGECGGSAEEDECGECGGPGAADGFDCDGNCIVDVDCAGECGGLAEFDECGICDGSGLNEDGCCGDETIDCTGECGGDTIEDCFGECGGDAIEDCLGDCGGLAAEDECGVCEGPGYFLCSIGLLVCDESACPEDCAGTPNGIAESDECGICDGPGLNEDGCCGDETIDCTGECGGDAIEDCAGECGGLAVFDECGICNGLGAEFICNDESIVCEELDCSEDCEGIPNGDALIDPCGTCDTDSDNDCVQDCSGEWGGEAFVDDCGQCVPAGTNPDDCLSSDLGIPDELYLGQNYPNPFNPVSVIDYGVSAPGNVNMSLYNLNGRKVIELINSFHSPGYYSITLSSENLNSSIYILKLISSSEVRTKKIAVVK